MSARRTVLPFLAAILCLAAAPAARAAVCALDDVPAATLLLPYFEVDLASPNGRTTLFSIGNAGPAAALAHVVLWTDVAVPTMAFDVYLTGFDVETLNLRDLFNGVLPRTADDARDPGDLVSPKGDLSQDASFPDCAGLLPPAAPAPAFVEHLRRAHQGLSSSLFAGHCAGIRHRDGVARGFVTVDVATRCSPLVPGDAGYFGPAGVAGSANVLWGDFFYVDPAGNLAQGEGLVRIEADPVRFAEDHRTFYAGWTGSGGADRREPLGERWASRFLEGGAFAGGTDFVVWREPPVRGEEFSCTLGRPSWVPLEQAEVVHFDEEETPEELRCVVFPFPSPSLCLQPFAVAAQRVGLSSDDLPASFPFGWTRLDFRLPGLNTERRQAWVGTTISAAGRYSVGYEGTALDTGCDDCVRGRQAAPGRLCVRGPLAAGQPVELEIFPKGCFSSACTERLEASCAVTQSGGILALDTRICLETLGSGACTPDCNGAGSVRCSSAGLPAGSYEARAGTLRVAFTIPGTVPAEGLCVGSSF